MIGELADAAVHPPEAAIVLVTVYVPGVLAVRSICPVLVLINSNPAGVAVNTPALPPPLYVGEGFIPPAQ